MIIVLNQKSILKSVISMPDNSQRWYIACSALTPQTLNVLKEYSFKEIPAYSYSAAEKKVFIAQVNRVVDYLGRVNNHLTWLSSDVLSKNRFSNPLIVLLEQLWNILNRIEQSQCTNVVIIEPDVCIVDTLKKILNHRAQRCKVIGNQWSGRIQNVCLRLRKMGGMLKSAAAHVLRIRLLKNSNVDITDKTADEWIKTFTYNHSFTDDCQYTDVFFSPLIKYYQSQCLNFKILVHSLGDFKRLIDYKKRANDSTLIPYEAMISYTDVWVCLKDVLFNPIYVPLYISFYTLNVRSLIRELLWANFRSVQFQHAIQYRVGINLASQTESTLTNVVMTYENYPWERVFIKALKESGRNVNVTGYQHTVVPEAYTNYHVSRLQSTKYVFPDKVFTTGQVTADVIRNYSETPFVLQSGCAMRFEKLLDRLSVSEHAHSLKPEICSHVLVPVEGVKEAVSLIQYVLHQSKELPQVEFRIRTHPLFPWAYYEKLYGFDLEKYHNVHCSTNRALQLDLEWGDCTVYWSTTVSLESVAAGRPIIHFDRGDILSFDPVQGCTAFKRVVTHGASLGDVLAEFNALTQEQWTLEKLAALKFLNNYFYSISSECLNRFSVHSSQGSVSSGVGV